VCCDSARWLCAVLLSCTWARLTAAALPSMHACCECYFAPVDQQLVHIRAALLTPPWTFSVR
jgi:hypothetical protein